MKIHLWKAPSVIYSLSAKLSVMFLSSYGIWEVIKNHHIFLLFQKKKIGLLKRACYFLFLPHMNSDNDVLGLLALWRVVKADCSFCRSNYFMISERVLCEGIYIPFINSSGDPLVSWCSFILWFYGRSKNRIMGARCYLPSSAALCYFTVVVTVWWTFVLLCLTGSVKGFGCPGVQTPHWDPVVPILFLVMLPMFLLHGCSLYFLLFLF